MTETSATEPDRGRDGPSASAEGRAPLRVLAADDELVARKRLRRLLGAMPGVALVDCVGRAQEVLEVLQRETVDVLVLDIQMPGLTGIELRALLPEPAPHVVFATAHPEHAVDAFELGAVDYVLKPIEAGRLGKAMERARARVERRRRDGASEAEPAATSVRPLPHPSNHAAEAPVPREDALALDRLPITTREGVVLLPPGAISHAVFDGTLVTVTTREGQRHLTDASLQELQGRLPADRFVRAHRRAVLNLHEVVLLRPTESGGYLAVMRTDDEVPVSRQTARRLRRALGL